MYARRGIVIRVFSRITLLRTDYHPSPTHNVSRLEQLRVGIFPPGPLDPDPTQFGPRAVRAVREIICSTSDAKSESAAH